MKKFLIVLLCILCVLGLSGLSVWLITRSIDTEEEILDDSSEFDDGFVGNTSTQEDGKEDSSESSSSPSGDESPETNIYFTLPDRFTSGDYLLDLNERVQVVPYCYPDYTYFIDYIVWTSSDPSVVSIQPLEDLVSSCYLIGESEGYSTITATYEDQSISFDIGVSTLFGKVNHYVYYDCNDVTVVFRSSTVISGGVFKSVPSVIFNVPFSDTDFSSDFLISIESSFSDYISINQQSFASSDETMFFVFSFYFEYSRLCVDLGVLDTHPSFSFPFALNYQRVLDDDLYTRYIFDYSFNLKFDFDGTVSIFDCSSPYFSICDSIYSNFGGIG